MNSVKLTVTEIVRNFSEYINRIIYKHEKFILLKGKKPVAELKPIPSGFSLGKLPDILLTLPKLSETDAVDFLNELKEIRNNTLEEKLKDPWESY